MMDLETKLKDAKEEARQNSSHLPEVVAIQRAQLA